MKKVTAYIYHYIFNVGISYGVFLPICYILKILQAIKDAVMDSDYEISESIAHHKRVNLNNIRRIKNM